MITVEMQEAISNATESLRTCQPDNRPAIIEYLRQLFARAATSATADELIASQRRTVDVFNAHVKRPL